LVARCLLSTALRAACLQHSLTDESLEQGRNWVPYHCMVSLITTQQKWCCTQLVWFCLSYASVGSLLIHGIDCRFYYQPNPSTFCSHTSLVSSCYAACMMCLPVGHNPGHVTPSCPPCDEQAAMKIPQSSDKPCGMPMLQSITALAVQVTCSVSLVHPDHTTTTLQPLLRCLSYGTDPHHN
jgi:hypothetical protein